VNPFAELGNAAIGWLDLIAAREGAASRFGTTGKSVANAIGFFFVMLVACLLLQALVFGGDWLSLWIAIAIAALPLLGALSVTWASAAVLNMPAQPMLAAIAYALAFAWPLRLAAGLVFRTDIGLALIGALGYMFYRAARVIGGQPPATAIAYAIVAVIALVLMPFALYILTASGPLPDQQ
jgi:hypothetical protein